MFSLMSVNEPFKSIAYVCHDQSLQPLKSFKNAVWGAPLTAVKMHVCGSGRVKAAALLEMLWPLII